MKLNQCQGNRLKTSTLDKDKDQQDEQVQERCGACSMNHVTMLDAACHILSLPFVQIGRKLY